MEACNKDCYCYCYRYRYHHYHYHHYHYYHHYYYYHYYYYYYHYYNKQSTFIVLTHGACNRPQYVRFPSDEEFDSDGCRSNCVYLLLYVFFVGGIQFEIYNISRQMACVEYVQYHVLHYHQMW